MEKVEKSKEWKLCTLTELTTHRQAKSVPDNLGPGPYRICRLFGTDFETNFIMVNVLNSEH